ncbi:MAG: hypothetical protein JWP30_1526 [Homoserinimonas sp.]|nr:hypothetical protein [Homoserinimonas sp.]
MAKSDTPQPSTGSEPALPPSAKKALTVKQQREERRQEKVKAFKKEQAKAKRNRLVAIILSSAAAVAVLAILITVVVTSSTQRNPDDITVAGVETWEDIEFGHVETPVNYEEKYGTNPPVGGVHNPAWLNCGVYTEPQQNENAVHALEHGAVWVTYNAEEISEEELQLLVDKLPSTHILVSPYEGLDAPLVASGWGAQVKLDGVDDERLTDFVDKYWQSENVPEPGARCDGAIDGPGKIA